MGTLLSFSEFVEPDQLILAHFLVFRKNALVLRVVRHIDNIGEVFILFFVGLQKSLEILVVLRCSLNLLGK